MMNCSASSGTRNESSSLSVGESTSKMELGVIVSSALVEGGISRDRGEEVDVTSVWIVAAIMTYLRVGE